MDDLTAFRRDILVIIAGLGAPHGLGIKAELEGYYPEAIDYGRLYPNLNWLAEQGFIAKSTRDARSNEYQLTDQGEQRLTEHRDWVTD